MKFRPGDKVRRTRKFTSPELWATKYGRVYTVKDVGFTSISLLETFDTDGTWDESYFDLVLPTDFTQGSPLIDDIHIRAAMTFDNTKVTTMELKDVKKSNLKEAKKQFDEQKANEEIAFAKGQLLTATNEVDRLDREIKQREEAKEPFLETIAKFA